MRGSIYLIGGGEIRNGETFQIDEELKSLASEGSNFAFFGSAAQDSTAYSKTVKSVFGDKFKVLVPTKKKGREYAINTIKSSSIIYLGGGDTDLLMQLFKEWGLVEFLTAALERGVHIAGMSAGALALSSWYIQEDNDLFEIKKGWGIAPVGSLVHANQNSFKRVKSLLTKLNRNNYSSFIAIGERAAWRIDSAGEHKVGSGNIWILKKDLNVQ
jgi:dipeptidase E